MAWWIWLVLAIFAVVVLILGALYVLLKGKKALAEVGPLTDRVQKDLAAVAEGPKPSDHDTLIAQPLSVATERYEVAHANRIEYKKQRRLKHTENWQRWESFNDLKSSKDGNSPQHGKH